MDNEWMKISDAIACRVNDRLKQIGILKQEFACMMGVKPSVVTKWLSGASNFQISTITRMEQVLGIELIKVAQVGNHVVSYKYKADNENKFNTVA